MTTQSNRARTGAVLLCDALGFRGLWRRNAQDLIRTIELIHKRTNEMAEIYSTKLQSHVRAAFHAFSDTIAFSVVSTSEDNSQELDSPSVDRTTALANCVMLCAHAAQLIQRVAAEGDCPLVYRGAIAAGSITQFDRVLMGEPVDEAASHMEYANAAVIRLTPSASQVIEDRLRSEKQTKTTVSAGAIRPLPMSALMPYVVPMVDGATIKSLVVNPFTTMLSKGRRDGSERTLRKSMCTAFDRALLDIRVEAKKKYTLLFLAEAWEWANNCSDVLSNHDSHNRSSSFRNDLELQEDTLGGDYDADAVG